MGEGDMDMIQVVCFYWQGDRWQSPGYVPPKGHTNAQQSFIDVAGKISPALPARYVNNLFRGVKRFADRPFEFTCFTNEPMEVDSEIRLKPFPIVTEHGVLPRVYMFSREAGLMGHQVLCFDLDVVITGSLKSLMDYDGLFCTRTKFKPGEGHKIDGDIMSFRANEKNALRFWDAFVKDVDAAVHLTQGRERYWVRHVTGNIADTWDTYAPGQIRSYKRHIRNRAGVPPGVSVVSCHGLPRPHEITNNWIKHYWK